MIATTTTKAMAAAALLACTLLQLQQSLVHSFAPGATQTVFGIRKNHQNQMSPSLTTVQASLTAADAAAVKRNMFQSSIYDKPIVLLGCSGKGDELNRLAQSLKAEMNGNTIVDTAAAVAASSDGSLLNQIEHQHLNLGDVIVLDFNGNDEEDALSALAKSLYEDAGILSIYVNVHAEAGQLSEESVELKTKLDDTIFFDYSDYELCIRDEGLSPIEEEWSHMEWELTRLVARATYIPVVPGDKEKQSSAFRTMGQHTFFLSLSFPNITEVKPYIAEMCNDVDAMEFRADLLACRDDRFDLIYSAQLLRKYCKPYAIRAPGLPFKGKVLDDVMPIVYTVRTQSQIGTYPDDEAGISKMFELLEWGLRSGVEVLDVESAHDPAKTDALLTRAEQRHASMILGSEHIAPQEISTEEAVDKFLQCGMGGRAHGTKVVLSIENEERDRMAYEAGLIAQSMWEKNGDPIIPCLSLILGDIGKYSRVLNFGFTPVTHESLPFKAAPGQLTASEIMTTRLLIKLFQPKRYCILGHNIAYSVSPQMQGAAFAAAKLPHEYYRADVETVEEFVESDFFKAEDFGGCSITIPHKQAIIPYLDEMSPAAKTIGSVNTIVVKEDIGADEIKRIVYGDNTDWQGIFNPLERKLGGGNEKGINGSDKQGFALIVGAGGTARAAAYAAEKLGLEKIYYNRTPEKAADLAETFGGTVTTSLEDSVKTILEENNGSISVVISTLPAAAEFTLPDWILNEEGPVVFDVNYKPYNTKLLLQAEGAGLDVVRGSEMLWEQGVGQFEMWTARSAPYKVMKDEVLGNCLPKEEEEKPKEEETIEESGTAKAESTP
mmetsp:Transcript_18281/g.28233  ORF Transcript_18281/g.28233 Transcript_18281/m.28233 type:complete len:833 (+) Transcript_18281:128-2626(+)